MSPDGAWPALRPAWHVVATREEIGNQPRRVWLLGDAWCLVRRDGGEVVAFADRCPHRRAPLSAGSVCDGVLECVGHGWRFDTGGRCVAIPALAAGETIPAGAGLTRPYGVTERYGLVWLAPEEPVEALPELAAWDDPTFDRARSTIVRTPVGATQLVDNFLDASHFPFVHAGTFGAAEAAFVADRGVTREGWSVVTTFDTWYRNRDDPRVATGEHPEIQPQILLKRGGASCSVVLRLDFPVTGATIAILFSCTPEREGSTRVYKLMARNDLAGDADALGAFVADEDRILEEDLAILGRYRDHRMPVDLTVEVHTKADRLSVGWRRVVSDLLRRGPSEHAATGR